MLIKAICLIRQPASYSLELWFITKKLYRQLIKDFDQPTLPWNLVAVLLIWLRVICELSAGNYLNLKKIAFRMIWACGFPVIKVKMDFLWWSAAIWKLCFLLIRFFAESSRNFIWVIFSAVILEAVWKHFCGPKFCLPFSYHRRFNHHGNSWRCYNYK